MDLLDYDDMFTLDRDGQRLTWAVSTLQEAAQDLAVEEVPVTSLEHLLDEVVWFGVGVGAEHDRPTVRAVAVHAERIQSVELEFPIILSKDGALMDGMHRLAKAWMLGEETIKVTRLVEEPEPEYIEVLGDL